MDLRERASSDSLDGPADDAMTANQATWARDAIFYHVYPLGLCGAPSRNDFASAPEPRLDQLHRWIDHWRELGVNALYLGPLFESTAHGYDTANYYEVDRRLGTNAHLERLMSALHAADIRVILDGVFNHVGRDFWAFRDLRERGEQSAYRDWFVNVNFHQRSPFGDPFSYEGWSGCFDLIKLNLKHPDVRAHLLGAVDAWIQHFAIDGLRLDAADVIDLAFLRELSEFARARRPDFWLMGEIIHGDYRRWANTNTLDSVTNYECYKGLFSSHNDKNFHEIAYSLNRQFGREGIYRDLTLYNFAENHDVNRVASALRDPAHLYSLYLLLFTMPGVPSIYAGGEWGMTGVKQGADDGPLRPAIAGPEFARSAPHPDLAPAIARFADVRRRVRALREGSYEQLAVGPEHLAFARTTAAGERAIVAVNASATPAKIEVASPGGGTFVDALNPGEPLTASHGKLTFDAPPRWGRVLVKT